MFVRSIFASYNRLLAGVMLAAMAIGLNELVRRAEVRFSRWRSG